MSAEATAARPTTGAAGVTRADMSAAPLSLHFDGREYRMSPVTDADMGEIERWVQSHILRVARESLDDDTPESDRRIVIDSAMQKSAMVNLATPDSIMQMNSLQGLTRLYWLGLRKNHPDITIREVEQLMGDADVRRQLDEAWRFLNEHEEEDDEGEGGPKRRRAAGAGAKKKRARKKARKARRRNRKT